MEKVFSLVNGFLGGLGALFMALIPVSILWFVLTGRSASKDLIDNADLVTEMSLIHHPFKEQGIKAQAGVEY